MPVNQILSSANFFFHEASQHCFGIRDAEMEFLYRGGSVQVGMKILRSEALFSALLEGP